MVFEEAEPACLPAPAHPAGDTGVTPSAPPPQPCGCSGNRFRLAATARSERVCPRTSRSSRAWGPPPASPGGVQERLQAGSSWLTGTPGGVRAPRFRVELVQAVSARNSVPATCLQGPAGSVGGGSRKARLGSDPSAGTRRPPAPGPRGRFRCVLPRGPRARASLGLCPR